MVVMVNLSVQGSWMTCATDRLAYGAAPEVRTTAAITGGIHYSVYFVYFVHIGYFIDIDRMGVGRRRSRLLTITH
jgi:hypothetical protein